MCKLVVVGCLFAFCLVASVGALCTATSSTTATSKSVDAYTESFKRVFERI